ncbi:hypothetical protein Tco_1106534 [Tanacetum coccineum]
MATIRIFNPPAATGKGPAMSITDHLEWPRSVPVVYEFDIGTSTWDPVLSSITADISTPRWELVLPDFDQYIA